MRSIVLELGSRYDGSVTMMDRLRGASSRGGRRRN